MRTVEAKVVSFRCEICRDRLLADCREFELPNPTGQVIIVPASWKSYKCPHVGYGFDLDFLPAGANAIDREDDIEAESMRSKGTEEIEAPAWWRNLDATRGIGYPAREEGRYGSHPSHDGFDDESDP
jgi:hypothetical protein